MNKYMRVITNNSGIYNNISDDLLNEIVNMKHGYQTLQKLKAIGAIDYSIAFGGNHLYNGKLLDSGVLYFYNKAQKMLSFIIGFIFGILSSFIASKLI